MKRLQELTSITESYVSPAFEKSITGWWVVTHHNGKLKCVSFGPYTKKHVAEREAKQTGFDVAYGKRNSKGFLVPLSNQEPDLHTTRVQESIKPRWIVNVKRSDGQVEEKKVRASSVEAIKKHYGENFVSAEPADEDLDEAPSYRKVSLAMKTMTLETKGTAMSDPREQLKTMLQDLINDRHEQAEVTIHNYIVAKTQQLAGFSHHAQNSLTENGGHGLVRNVYKKTNGWKNHQVIAGNFCNVPQKYAQMAFDTLMDHDVVFGVTKKSSEYAFYFDNKNVGKGLKLIGKFDSAASENYAHQSHLSNLEFVDDDTDDDDIDDDGYNPDRFTEGDIFQVKKPFNDGNQKFTVGDQLIFHYQNKRMGRPADEYFFKSRGKRVSLTFHEIDSNLKLIDNTASKERRKIDDVVSEMLAKSVIDKSVESEW